MFGIMENHFLFVGLFIWGIAETQTFTASRNRDGLHWLNPELETLSKNRVNCISNSIGTKNV